MIRKYWRVLVYVCAIPTVAFGVFWGVLLLKDADWMEAVQKDFPRATAKELSARSLDTLCASPGTAAALAGLCKTRNRLEWSRGLAAATLGSSLLVLVGVYWVGRRCRRSRKLLLKSFRAGSYAMTAVTLLSVCVQGYLLAASLYYASDVMMERLFMGMMVLSCFGVLLGLIGIGRLLYKFSREEPLELDGQFLPAERAPELWRYVESIAKAVGTSPPRQIVVGTNPAFFVTEIKVRTEGGRARGRTLFLSLPLCRILSKDELRAVIGHEMAHFYGRDTAFSRKFYPVFRRGANALDAMSDSAQSAGAGGFVLLPAIWLLSFYLESFSEAEAAISREREFAADAKGAELTTRRVAGLALTKIIQHQPAWEKAESVLLDSTSSDRTQWPSPGESFRETAEREFRSANRAEQIRKLEEDQLSHPADRHPPLRERLAALDLTVEEIYDAAGDIRPEDPSSNLFPDPDVLEREILPVFAPKLKEVQTIFCRRQPGFAAMEYHGVVLNRSFLVYVHPNGVYGIQFRGTVGSQEGSRFFEPVLEILDDPWFAPGTRIFKQEMKKSRHSFFIPWRDVAAVEFEGWTKWGMGNIPHAGTLRLRLTSGKKRDLILLGGAYGDGIRRFILEIRERAQPGESTTAAAAE